MKTPDQNRARGIFMKRSNVKPTEAEMSVTSTDLLRRAKANNQTAWQQLVSRYSRRIYRWCRRAGLQSNDAADVTQEVLHAVARKLGIFAEIGRGIRFAVG